MNFKDRQEEINVIGGNNKQNIGGSAFKRFSLINDGEKKRPIDSEYFYKLFSSLASGNSSYMTYANDLINDGYMPRYLMCMVVDSRQILGMRTEYGQVVGSVLANLLNIPTVYNIAVPSDDASVYSEYPVYDVILSVDATPTGYVFENMKSILEDTYGNLRIDICPEDHNLGKIVARLRSALEIISQEHSIVLTEDRVEKFIENFILQYLFKKCWCGDSDFDSKNIPIMIGKDESSPLYQPHYGNEESKVGDFFCAPMHDYECLFMNPYTLTQRETMVKDALDFCYANGYRNVIDDFMTKLEKHWSRGGIQEILAKTIEVSPAVIKNAKKVLSDNTNLMLNAWRRKKESTFSMETP